MPHPPAPPVAPTVLHDRYELLRRLGQGGSATAWLALDRLWNTQVAVKIVRTTSEPLLAALRNEFALLRALHHPHLAHVHDFAPLPERSSGLGRCFFTADFIQGPSLDNLARNGDWDLVRQPLCDALEALRWLHSRRLRHGDFKPANVIVSPDGRGTLIDLGCARPIPSLVEPTLSGSPGYLAPELLSQGTADHRADLFAVGIALRELLQACAQPTPRLDILVGRLLAPRPADRPADLDEVLEALGVEPASLQPNLAETGELVGRQAQMQRILEVLDALGNAVDAPRVLQILGPGGVGRSRVLRELKWEAQRRFRVLEANAHAPQSVASLLATALGAGHDIYDVAGVLDARDRLCARAEPVVFVVDDVPALDDSQQSLLRALARSLAPADPILLAFTADDRLELGACSDETIALQPLHRDDVRAWVGEMLSERVVDGLYGSTGGFPSSLVALLQEWQSGRVDESQLALGLGQLPADERRIRALLAAPVEVQRAAAWLAAHGPEDSGFDPEASGIAHAAVESLAGLGLAVRDGAAWRLVHQAESQRLLGSLPVAIVQGVHASIALRLRARIDTANLSGAQRSRQEANWLWHLANAGDHQEAEAQFLAGRDLHSLAPQAWSRCAEAIARASRDPRILLAAAVLDRQSGRPARAIDALLALRESIDAPGLATLIRFELANCRLDAGELTAAVAELEEAIAGPSQAEWTARCALLLARTHTRRGDYHAAAIQANLALESAVDEEQRAEALLAAGVANSFLGDGKAAREQLDEALLLLARCESPRLLVRAHGSRGLVSYNAGLLSEAKHHYARALEIAERQGLSDQIATAGLNYGTVCHQGGHWAHAWSSYERGLRMAVALGQRSTEALLRFDLVKLFTDVGLFDRAEASISSCEQAAQAAGAGLVSVELDTVRAEIALAQGRFDVARGGFERAREAFLSSGSKREQAEVELHLVDVHLGEGELARAESVLERVEQGLGHETPADIRTRAMLARARWLLAGKRPADALVLLEPGSREAQTIDHPDLSAQAQLLLARVWDTQGSSLLADRHRAAARETWERTAALLPDAVRDAFWRHPARAGARAASVPTERAPGPARAQRLERLLDINKRINSTLDTSELLRRAMDAAIELTGAERGFVLLVAEGRDSKQRLRVAVARNLDREQLDRSHLKFSRGIAEQVIATATAVSTADALLDARFEGAVSVHAMQLKSVACVPVVSPRGVLGALYLDNRFQRGSFSEEDVGLLGAFADQVAIALSNARLHRELAERNKELEDRNRRIEELARGQAEQIERLQEQVRVTQQSFAARYDYSAIVGASRAMQRVFSVLDRVMDTNLPILIQGESGTGKELVARAIHANGRNPSGPMVSINCGALPEALLESELFGYERGAFTGADRSRDGLLVRASGGTLFLDELGELPLTMQVKLLRVLQEREVRPLGSSRAIAVDFRLVCATNRRLREEMARGAFREDLYYRIGAIELTLPPLRERLDDIPALAARILERAAVETGRPAPHLTRSALGRLMSAPWPGNVRELENVLLRALVLCEGDRITAAELDLPVSASATGPSPTRAEFERSERDRIHTALAEHRWNVAKVARALGIPRPTLYRKLAKYRIVTPNEDDAATPAPASGAPTSRGRRPG